jgi:hypothetical protein
MVQTAITEAQEGNLQKRRKNRKKIDDWEERKTKSCSLNGRNKKKKKMKEKSRVANLRMPCHLYIVLGPKKEWSLTVKLRPWC